MANDLHRARKTTKVRLPIASATVLEVGDLVYHDSGNNDARPASSQADNGNEADNQAEFALNFLGVALDASADGDTTDVMVDTALDKEYSFTVPSATYRFGDLLGASEATSGTALEDQQLEAVGSQDLAIARVSDDSSSARTEVKCRFIRSKFQGLPRRPDVAATVTMTGDVTLTHDDAQMLSFDPGGSARTLTLPPEEESAGLMFLIANRADMAEVLTIQDDASAAICTPTQNESALVWCDGTGWYGLVGDDA